MQRRGAHLQYSSSCEARIPISKEKKSSGSVGFAATRVRGGPRSATSSAAAAAVPVTCCAFTCTLSDTSAAAVAVGGDFLVFDALVFMNNTVTSNLDTWPVAFEPIANTNTFEGCIPNRLSALCLVFSRDTPLHLALPARQN